jgi:hypothetical protein
MADILCRTKGGYPITKGSRWKENDPRFERIVFAQDYIVTRDKVGIVNPESGRMTWAARERFGGSRRGNYAPLDSSPSQFTESNQKG